MAEELKLGIVLEGIDKIISSIASLNGPFSKTMANIAESTKNATDVINMMTEAMERQKVVQAELGSAKNSSESGGGTSSASPPSSGDKSSGGGNVLPDTKELQNQLTVVGNLVNGFAESFRNLVSEADFEKVQQAIKEKFAAPMEDGEKKTKKAEEGIKKFSEGGVSSLEKLTAASKHFAEALTDASAGSALAGLQDLASIVASAASSFGATGAAAGQLVIGLAAVAAAAGTADAATLLLAEHAADSVIAMDNLGTSAGVSAAEIYSLQSAFDDLGASSEQFSTAIRSINNRMLSGWPEIKREVRDSADSMEAAYAKIAEAEQNLNRIKRDGALQDEKIRDAQRNVSDAQRNIEASQDNKIKAELAYKDALDGRVRSQLRAAEAQRQVSAAGREYEQSQINLRQALTKQKEAALDIADAYRAVREAQTSFSSANTSYASARLDLQEALYKQGLESGRRFKDPFLEQRIARQRKNLEIQALRDRVDETFYARERAGENVVRTKDAADNAGDIKRQADINVGNAIKGVADAADRMKTASLDAEKASREQVLSSANIKEAARNLAAANEGIPAATDKFAEAVEAFKRAVEDANNQPAREAEAARALRAAQNSAQDKKNADIPTIVATLRATEVERTADANSSNPRLVELTDVSNENMARAITQMASPNGGTTKPNAEQVIFTLADLLNKNKDSLDYGTIRAALAKTLSPRGDINAFLEAATVGGAAGLQKKMAESRVTAEELYGEGPIRNARGYEERKNVALTQIDEQAVREGNRLTPTAAEQWKVIGDQVSKIDFKPFTDGLKEATQAITGFIGALDKVRDWTNATGITTPTKEEQDKMSGGALYGNMVGTNIKAMATGEPLKWLFTAASTGISSVVGTNAWHERAKANFEQSSANMVPVINANTAALTRLANMLLTPWESKAPNGSERFSDGGHVRGPGTGTSDSIPSWLSNNEYVFTSDAVNHWGVGLLDRMNYGKGFAMGGLVGTPRIGFDRGGLGSMNHYALDIRTDMGSFTATVDGGTMEALTRSAMGAKLKSSGVKPSWYGK